MAGYDGTDFVGLDDDCIGNGSSSTLALDAWLSQRILGNQRRLTLGVDAASCAFWQEGAALDAAPSTNQGDRPWASVDWSMPVVIPLLLQPGLTSVEMACLWIAYQFGTASYVDIEWRLLNDSNRVIASSGIIALPTTLIWDDQSGDAEGVTRFTLDLSGAWSGISELGTLMLRIRSRVGSDTGDNYTLDADGRAGVPYVKNDARDLRPSAAGPLSGDMEIIGLQFSSTSGASSVQDVIGLWAQDSPNSDFMSVSPEPISVNPLSYDAHHLSYIQCRAIQVRMIYDEDSIGGVDEGELEAQQPIESGTMARLAQSPTSYHKRGRLLAWGPAGRIETRAEIWPAKYHTRFSRAYGSDAAATLIDSSISVPWTSGTIEVSIACIASFLQMYFHAGDGVGSSVWTFTLELLGFDTADLDWLTPTVVASSEIDFIFDTFATGPTRPERHLVGERYWRIGYAPREGQLFDEDLRIRRIKKIGVTASGLDMDMSYRLRLTTVADMAGLEAFPLGNEGVPYTTPQRLGLLCTGWTAMGYGT